MASNNAQIAAIFQRMADVLQILDANRFKVIAFQRAARVVDELAQDVADIEPSELKRIDGIGKGTAERIAEFLDTGRIADHDELVEEVPEGLFKLLDIPGMGAKTVALLWNQGQVTDIDGLKAAIESGQLEQLPGLGKKKLENIRNNIAFAETASQRTRLGVALPLAKSIVQALEQLPDVKRIDFAGSLRRGQETIGDIDILVATGKQGASKIADVFVNLDGVASVSAQGSTKCSVRTQDDIQIDLRMVPPASYGAALMYFTGSKEHNVAMRERAQSMGMTLNEYRLENKKTGRAVAGKTEEDVFAALKLDWIPPELRQDRGEIALAQQHALPALIELADVRSELHAHTTASDGHWSIEELADACAARGFHTVAVTDHSKGQAQANGLDNKRLERHIKQVRKVAERMKGTITILAGSEVDILASGKLDYPDRLLAQLDIVVASPHAALSQDPQKATARLRQAVENPHVNVLGHPTGRLIGRRAGLEPDIGALIQAARQRDVALEINANNWRLDLRDTHARAALEAGVKLSINTDAHGPADLDQLQYGILTARRAGATKKDVVNCFPAARLKKWLQL